MATEKLWENDNIIMISGATVVFTTEFYFWGVGEMTLWLSTLVAFSEDPGLFENTHIDPEYLLLQFQRILRPRLASVGIACMWCVHIHGSKTHKIKTSARQ